MTQAASFFYKKAVWDGDFHANSERLSIDKSEPAIEKTVHLCFNIVECS